MKTWGEMTDAEKGALLLAAHEGKTIEALWENHGWVESKVPQWRKYRAYRVAPKIEIVKLAFCDLHGRWFECGEITLIDGKPDAASVRLESDK